MLREEHGVRHRDLLLLAYVCEPQDEERYGPGGAPPGEAQRPELRVLSRHNEEVSSDALSLVGFEHYGAGAYRLAIQPQEDDDIPQARRGGAPPTGLPPDLTAYIMSPKDIVAARSRDWDDRLSWLLQRHQFRDALALARRQQAHLVRHKLADVAELYLAHLLHEQGDAATAAELCPEMLGESPALWQKWVGEFARCDAMAELAPYLPTATPQLPPAAYEGALLSLLEGHPAAASSSAAAATCISCTCTTTCSTWSTISSTTTACSC